MLKTITTNTVYNYLHGCPGNISIILTSPHGGTMMPDNIRSRDAGCWNATNQSCVFVHDCDAIGMKEQYGR